MRSAPREELNGGALTKALCGNSMQYSYQELFVPEFALPISISSFLAVTSQRSSVTTYDTWKS